MADNLATRVERIHGFLKQQRQVHHADWNEIARLGGSKQDFDYPAPVFEEDDPSRKRYDDTLPIARQAFIALLLAYGMNSMSKWFNFTLKDGKRPSPLVSQTLAKWHRDINAALTKAGLYSHMDPTAGSLGDFGSGILTLLPGPRRKAGFNGYQIANVPLSRIYYAVNADNVIDLCSEEIRQTAYQAFTMFTRSTDYLPEKVQKAYASSNGEIFKLIRFIEPVEPGEFGTRYRETYLFEGEKTPSRVETRKYFPHFVARLNVSSGSAYGQGCGGQCLASIRVANKLNVRGIQAADHAGLATWIADQHVRMNTENIRAGKLVRATNIDRVKTMDHKTDMSFWQVIYGEAKGNIRSAYFADLISLSSNRPEDMKAAVAEMIGQRQMMLLAPAFNHLDGDFFKPVLERAVQIYIDDALPAEKKTWPRELLDGINVESCSPIAKSQQQTEIKAWREFVTDAAGLMTVNPELADWFKTDDALFALANKYGIDMDMLGKAMDVRNIRLQRQAQEQAARNQANAVQQSAIVKDVAQARKYNSEASQI